MLPCEREAPQQASFRGAPNGGSASPWRMTRGSGPNPWSPAASPFLSGRGRHVQVPAPGRGPHGGQVAGGQGSAHTLRRRVHARTRNLARAPSVRRRVDRMEGRRPGIQRRLSVICRSRLASSSRVDDLTLRPAMFQHTSPWLPAFASFLTSGALFSESHVSGTTSRESPEVIVRKGGRNA